MSKTRTPLGKDLLGSLWGSSQRHAFISLLPPCPSPRSAQGRQVPSRPLQRHRTAPDCLILMRPETVPPTLSRLYTLFFPSPSPLLCAIAAKVPDPSAPTPRGLQPARSLCPFGQFLDRSLPTRLLQQVCQLVRDALLGAREHNLRLSPRLRFTNALSLRCFKDQRGPTGSNDVFHSPGVTL